MKIEESKARKIIKEEVKKLITIKNLKEQRQIVENELKEFGQEECPLEEPQKNLRETGKWDDSDDDLVAWKDALEAEVKRIEEETNGKLVLDAVVGFDKYQGPYAKVTIDDKNYNIWTVTDDGSDDLLWIEEYPVDNTSERGLRSGFEGITSEIIAMLNGEEKEVDEGIGIGISQTLKRSEPQRLDYLKK